LAQVVVDTVDSEMKAVLVGVLTVEEEEEGRKALEGAAIMIEVRLSLVRTKNSVLTVLVDYGGYSGSSGGFRDETSRRGGFEEYNAGDDETTVRRSTSISQRTGSVNTTSPRRTSSAAAASAPAPKPKEPEVDLLGGFGDDDTGSGGGVNALATDKALPALTTPATIDGEF
jgi:hypothetical protein